MTMDDMCIKLWNINWSGGAMVGFRLRDSREIQLMSNHVSDCIVRGKYVVALELDGIAMYTFLSGKMLLLWKISVLYKSPNWQETSLIGMNPHHLFAYTKSLDGKVCLSILTIRRESSNPSVVFRLPDVYSMINNFGLFGRNHVWIYAIKNKLAIIDVEELVATQDEGEKAVAEIIGKNIVLEKTPFHDFPDRAEVVQCSCGGLTSQFDVGGKVFYLTK